MAHYVNILFYVLIGVILILIFYNGLKVEIGKEWERGFYFKFEILPFKRFFF